MPLRRATKLESPYTGTTSLVADTSLIEWPNFLLCYGRGLTQTELERALATKFRSEYLKNPKITVTITNLRPFFITGEVLKPGIYVRERP